MTTAATDSTVQNMQSLLLALDLQGDDVASIMDAVRRSTTAINEARAALSGAGGPMSEQGEGLVAFGSLARYELTPSSDLDYLFITPNQTASGDLDDSYDSIIDTLRCGIVEGVTLAPPGASGLFGQRVSIDELTSNIGLQADTNHNLSRRILLLEESAPLYNEDLHKKTIEKILARYLESRKPGSSKVPRVLLNDIIRYWRTLAVDYHAKTSTENPYSLRYLKLLFSRKLCFVSSLAPLYLLSENSWEGDELEFLSEHYRKPAIIRLAELLNAVCEISGAEAPDIRSRSQSVIRALDYFIHHAGLEDWRSQVSKECALPDAKESSNFGEMRRLGQSVHSNLGMIFTSQSMLKFTREYMVL